MRKVMLGFILGSVLTFTTSSFADSIIAQFTNFIFKVNGETKTIQSKPVSIEGKSYLPVRDVGTMLGYSVNFDNGVIEFSNGNTTSSKPNTTNAITGKELHDKYGLQFVTSANDNNIMEVKINGSLIGSYSIKELTNNKTTSFTFNGKSIKVYLENGGTKYDKVIVDLVNEANKFESKNNYLFARELVEILGNKYPNKDISFNPTNSELKIDAKTIALNDFTTSLKGINYYNVQVLIDEGLLSENDLIFNN